MPCQTFDILWAPILCAKQITNVEMYDSDPLLYIMKFNPAAFETCFTHIPSNRNFYFPLDILISTLQGTDESPFFHRNIWHWWAISLTSKTKKGKKIISILYIDYRSPSVITWISIALILDPNDFVLYFRWLRGSCCFLPTFSFELLLSCIW